jgi:hypothetical protein
MLGNSLSVSRSDIGILNGVAALKLAVGCSGHDTVARFLKGGERCYLHTGRSISRIMELLIHFMLPLQKISLLKSNRILILSFL